MLKINLIRYTRLTKNLTVLHNHISRSSPNLRYLSTSNFNLKSKNYYDTLGVNSGATQKEVKQAYYKQAKQFHPDANPDNDEAAKKFAEAAEAYEVLGDETKRKEYDTLGAAGYDFNSQQQGMGGAHGGFGGAGGHQHINPEDLFESIFGEFAGSGGRKARRTAMGDFFDGFGHRQGANEWRSYESDYVDLGPYKVDMTLRFEEAARGCNKRINLEVYDNCPDCEGTGAKPGSKVVRCGHCNGTGVEQHQSGPFLMRGTCRKCQGSGKVITDLCNTCNGKGLTQQAKSIAIAVPAGVQDGQTIRVQMNRTEIFVTIAVMVSEIYKRENDNVLSLAKISIAQAVLGGATQVQTLHGEETFEISPGTSSGDRVIFRGKGVKKLQQTGYGDHISTIEIIAPKEITDEQKQLMIAFGEQEDFKGWANGVVPGTNSRLKQFFDIKEEDIGSKGEFDSDNFTYDDESEKNRRKYDKKTRRFHDQDSEEIEKSNRNKAKENTNKVRQEKIEENTDKITEKLYNKENYEEPYHIDATRKLDEMKKDSISYQEEVRRGKVNKEEQETYFENMEEKEGGVLGKIKKKFFN